MILSKLKNKLKSLIIRKKKTAGRNNTGRITVSHQGGGHKQKFRKILLNESHLKGFVINFEYDPNRTAYLAKIQQYQKYNKKEKHSYIIASSNLKILDFIQYKTNNEQPVFNTLSFVKQESNCYFLDSFNIGDHVYNIEIFPNCGAKLVRSAGTFATILQKTSEFVTLKMPSGEHRLFSSKCKAFLGEVSNQNFQKISWKKAGKSRWLNIRPTVRGVAKNPIDHPHGGNTSGGCLPKTPWGKLTKGQPTRSKKKINYLILKSKKNNKN